MATTTPNLGLTLPIGSEKVSRQILNGNFSLIDTAYGTLNSNVTSLDTRMTNAEDSITSYAENSSTASRAYSAGDYIRWYGRVYKVESNIAQGATISTSTNVTLINGYGGISNSLNSNLATKVPYQTVTTDCDTFLDGITIVRNTNDVSNLPINARCAVLQFTLFNNPLRKLQYAFVIDTMKIYVRSYANSWNAWSSFALDS